MYVTLVFVICQLLTYFPNLESWPTDTLEHIEQKYLLGQQFQNVLHSLDRGIHLIGPTPQSPNQQFILQVFCSNEIKQVRYTDEQKWYHMIYLFEELVFGNSEKFSCHQISLSPEKELQMAQFVSHFNKCYKFRQGVTGKFENEYRLFIKLLNHFTTKSRKTSSETSKTFVRDFSSYRLNHFIEN